MKFGKTTFCFFVLVTFMGAVGIVTAQPQPCLRLSTTGAGAVNESLTCTTPPLTEPFPLPGNRVSLQISDNPPSLDQINPLARYKAFWIFGDGNFGHYPHGGSLFDDIQWNTQIYNYHRPGSYTARAVLSEKKSNDEPPKRTARELGVGTIPGGGTMSPFKHTLIGTDNTLDIFNSEVNRPKHPTAFAVSAPKIFNTLGVFFFYNRSYSTTQKNFVPAEIMAENAIEIELPWYMKTRGIVPVKGNTTVLSGPVLPGGLRLTPTVVSALQSQYRNFIYVPFTPIYGNNETGGATFGEVPDAFDEFRFFSVLKTTLFDGTLPTTRFAAISVSKAQASPNIDTFFNSKRLSNLNDEAARMFGGTSAVAVGSVPNIDQEADSVYLIGVRTLDVEMKAAIDPNKIEVMKICPKGGGQYEVRFQVEICNEGYEDENAPKIQIKDPQDLFQNFIFEGTVNHDSFSQIAGNAATIHEWTFTWNQVLGQVPEPNDPDAESQAPRCAQFYFSATTDWEGVQRLVAREGLELCVIFSGGAGGLPECHYNASIDATKLTQKSGYECGIPDPPTCCCCCGFLCIMLIIVLIAILIWWFWKKKTSN